MPTIPASTMNANGTKTIDLADLFARRVQTVEVAITDEPGDVFRIRYKPDAFTKQVQAELQAAEGEDAAALLLVRLIDGWDLTSGGEPYPVTTETLEALGYPLLMAIAQAVMGDFETRVSLGKPTLTASSRDSNGT